MALTKEWFEKAEKAIEEAKAARARSSHIAESFSKNKGLAKMHQRRSEMLSTLIYLAELGLDVLKEEQKDG